MKKNQDLFKKNGYILVENFFNKEEISNLLNDAKNVFLKQFINKKYIIKTELKDISDYDFNKLLYRLFEEDIDCLSNCGKQIQHLVSLHRLSLSTKITDLLLEFGIKTPAISTRPVLFFNHPKLAREKVFYKVDAHQDWRSMQGSLNSLVIWIPLININKSIGALEILPGSHLNGLRTKNMESGFGMVELNQLEEKQLISVEVEQGDALIFSSLLVHRSGDNISDEPRWSCHFRYNDLDDESFVERKYAHAYLYRPLEKLITKNFPTIKDVLKIYG